MATSRTTSRTTPGPGRGPVVDVAQIQGNVIPGFATDHQMLLALRIERPAAARGWLAALAGEVTTAREVLATRARQARRGPWLNLAFSYAAITKLTESACRFNDEAFRAGLAARSGLLGDPTDPADEANPARWVVGGRGTELDVLVVVAGSEEYPVRRRATEIRDAALRSGLSYVWHELGSRLSRRPDEKSSEHFGFRDGIAQPGVRGRSADPDLPLTRRLINNHRLPDGPDLAAPGTPLVWPGSFVFGYPAQNPGDARAPGPLAVAGPYWAHNGSYLVFRRLRQDVVRFAEFLRAAANQHGLEPEALGALLIGRWRSGAPVVRTTPEGGQSPGKDCVELGADADANNDFDFTDELPDPVFRDGHPAQMYRRGRVDPLGVVCPASAHIRKVNPRGGYTEQGGLEDTLTRRILRRGIPYGPQLDDPLAADAQERDADRGLHFLCYQTSIVDQFEFLTRMWINSPSAPRGGGMDLLVGQRPGQPRTCYLRLGSTGPIVLETTERFVIPTGGEYLFVPSIYGLAKLVDPD